MNMISRWSTQGIKMCRFGTTTLLSISCLAALLTAQQTVPQMPMVAKYEDGAEFRWLNKKVLDSRVLDSMEDVSSWSFAGAGEMTLTEVRAKDGRHALRIRSISNIAQVGGDQEWEDLVATR